MAGTGSGLDSEDLVRRSSLPMSSEIIKVIRKRISKLTLTRKWDYYFA